MHFTNRKKEGEILRIAHKHPLTIYERDIVTVVADVHVVAPQTVTLRFLCCSFVLLPVVQEDVALRAF